MKSRKNKTPHSTTKSDERLIKDIAGNENISKHDVEVLSKIDYPLFSFRYLCDVSFRECTDSKFFINFLSRLKKLSQIGWKEIRTSHRHSLGREKMPVTKILHADLLPKFVTREVELDVYRSAGDNRVMIGLQESKIFHVFFIEAKHGDISPH